MEFQAIEEKKYVAAVKKNKREKVRQDKESENTNRKEISIAA